MVSAKVLLRPKLSKGRKEKTKMSKKQSKTIEQELKEKLKQGDQQDWCDDLENCPCCISYELKGIKEGKQIREDEIIKIIKRRIKFWTLRKDTINVEPCRNKKVELEELEEEITKQKIKGDDD